jgi:aryl-alcohol dehydrogenase-like predicted oxidoreductase
MNHLLPLNRIVLGSAQFGLDYGINNSHGSVSLLEIKRIITLAKEKKVDMIDTAISYGNAEKKLGMIDLNGLNVISKIPSLDCSAENIEQYLNKLIDKSLKNLNLETFYSVLLHNPLDLLKKDGEILFRGLQNLQEKGKIKKIGISIYSPEELNLLLKKYQFDIIQSPFNLIDRSLKESGWLNKLKDVNIEIHTRSSFLQGLLLISRENIPSKFTKWNYIWDKWDSWLQLNDISKVDACLSYCLSHKEIDRVIVGVDSYKQWKQILDRKKKENKINFPNIKSSDKMLINPSNWVNL